MKRKSSLPQFAMPRRNLESCDFPFSVATPNFVNLNFERGFAICLWNYRWKASWNPLQVVQNAFRVRRSSLCSRPHFFAPRQCHCWYCVRPSGYCLSGLRNRRSHYRGWRGPRALLTNLRNLMRALVRVLSDASVSHGSFHSEFCRLQDSFCLDRHRCSLQRSPQNSLARDFPVLVWSRSGDRLIRQV